MARALCRVALATTAWIDLTAAGSRGKVWGKSAAVCCRDARPVTASEVARSQRVPAADESREIRVRPRSHSCAPATPHYVPGHGIKVDATGVSMRPGLYSVVAGPAISLVSIARDSYVGVGSLVPHVEAHLPA